MIARLALGHPQLPVDTLRPERVSVLGSSLSPLSLVHPLMVSPLLAPATLCHMMHAKANAVGMTQQVSPFSDWLRATTVEPQQGISDLASVDLADSNMAQCQGISTSLVPPPPPSASSKPADPAAAAVSAASPGPAARSC